MKIPDLYKNLSSSQRKGLRLVLCTFLGLTSGYITQVVVGDDYISRYVSLVVGPTLYYISSLLRSEDLPEEKRTYLPI